MNLLQILRHALHLEREQSHDGDSKFHLPDFDDNRERELRRRADALQELANSLQENNHDSG